MFRTVLMIGSVIALSLTGNTLAAGAYYNFAEEPINTRASAMGTAGTALLNGGGFSYYNPALPFLSQPNVNLEFGKLFEDLGRGQLELVGNFTKWFVAASIQSQTIEFEYADERGIKSGSIGSEQGVLASISAGLKKERFALALAVNGIHDRIAGDYSYGFTGSVGALYQVIPQKLIAGASIIHFYGRNTNFIDTLDTHFGEDELPRTIRAGVSWTDSLKGKIPYTISSDVVYSFNFDKLMVPIGAEAWVLPMLALRLGARIKHPTDVLTFGMGLKLANLLYDVAFTPMNYEGDVKMKWTMGLTYQLPFASKSKQASKKTADSLKAVSPAVIDSPKTAPVETDSVEVLPTEDFILKDDSTEVILPAETDTVTETAAEVKSDSVPVLHTPGIDSTGSSGNQQEDQKNNDSIKNDEIKIENSSEKATSPDSVIIQKETAAAVSDSAGVKSVKEADNMRLSDTLNTEKKESQIPMPVDSNADKK